MRAQAVNDERTTLTPPEIFRLLADETRLRALVLLHAEGELCVCELTIALEVSQPKMSRHLALMRDAGLVADRRERVWIHYRIAPAIAKWIGTILDAACTSVVSFAPYREDRRRLAVMPDRPSQRCRN
ncbi:ArsR family transcriptional regulator [Salinisphaera sp. PC39]|uniref:metalloregulator ArsR/SmtB family transcription factor n=1 Tax=Salinisphaera sp. PC39 TaxID=1304156 RepID=UPI00333FF074